MSASTFAVLGLGEAGRTFAETLALSAPVVGWDPMVTAAPAGVVLASTPADAVADADAILAFTPAARSAAALGSITAAARARTLYADFATSAPATKRQLAVVAADAGLAFVDAAIMAPVRRGAADVPLLLCGDGAQDLRALLVGAGLQVEVLSGPPGAAAARKLLRSVLVKGLTGVLIEALRVAEAEDLLGWFSAHSVDVLTSLDQKTLAGFIDGTRAHSARRVDELEAAATMAEATGRTAAITRAVAELLRSVPDQGIPVGEALDV